MFATYLIFFLAICYAQSTSVPQDVADSIPTYLFGKNYTFNVNNKKYLVMMDNQNMTRALDRCERLGLKLLSVETKDESDAITENLINLLGEEDGHFWTSGIRLASVLPPAQWAWLTAGKFVTFTNWGEGEPNNSMGNQDCIKIVKASWQATGSWDDAQCVLANKYICEE